MSNAEGDTKALRLAREGAKRAIAESPTVELTKPVRRR